MKYKPTEKELQKWGKKITKSLYGFTKDDLEPLFEKYVLPIYVFASRRIDENSKWKIVNRETGKEYSVGRAISKLGILNKIYSLSGRENSFSGAPYSSIPSGKDL